MIYLEFWTEGCHISRGKFTPDHLFASMGKFHVKVMRVRSLWVLNPRVSLFSISLRFTDVAGWEAGGSTEVSV